MTEKWVDLALELFESRLLNVDICRDILMQFPNKINLMFILTTESYDLIEHG